ncbi:MAG: ComF family protein [Aquificae bacterium]|nr:ComF family protein [Aquificota bacterium]
MNLLEKLLFGEFCAHCERREVGAYGLVCDPCLYSLRPEPSFREVPYADGVLAFAPYKGAAKTLLNLIKFQGAKKLLEPLAEVAKPTFERFLRKVDPDWVSFVPTHPLRVWFSRGFDQTEELLKRLYPEYARVFSRRWVPRRPLARLKGRERRSAIKGVFELRLPPPAVKGKRFLIVDDVVTTGSTAAELALLLKSAGASEVFFFALFDGSA